MRYIFDLDGTVIDSSHRKAVKPDGTLDLEHWIENSTPEMVAKDKLLPLANIMRNLYRNGGPTRQVIICTARVLGDADYWYLAEHSLAAHHVLSRPLGCRWDDASLKLVLLSDLARNLGLQWADFRSQCLMFDDAPSVIEGMNKVGIRCIDAKGYNAILPRQAVA